jgi:hypothetical protein
MKESAVYLILYAVSIAMIIVGVNGTWSGKAMANIGSIICLIMGIGLFVITLSIRNQK